MMQDKPLNDTKKAGLLAALTAMDQPTTKAPAGVFDDEEPPKKEYGKKKVYV